MLKRAAIALLTLASATAACAAPKDELHIALAKFLAQTSFRGDIAVDMAGRSMRSVVEFQAPDRLRVSSEGRPPVVIIGTSMYMTTNGHPMKVPVPNGNPMSQYRNAALLAQLEHGMTVVDLGMDSIGGMPAHKYRYSVEKPQPSTSTIWVSTRSGLPMQVQTSRPMAGKSIDSTIVYSHFGDAAIKIVAPN